MRLFALILCVVSVCSSQPLPGSKDSPTWNVLYAWQDLKDQSWSFRLVSALKSSGWTVKEIVEGDGVLRGLEQLQKAISKMKPGSTVVWASSLALVLGNGSGIDIHLAPPPESLVEKVRLFCEKQQVELSMNYCRCSP